MIQAKEKTTALISSVGADERQSLQSISEQSIAPVNTKNNRKSEVSVEDDWEQMLRDMQRMADPTYLRTITMNNLMETVYLTRPPVIDGLLSAGMYILAGASKIGKSFMVAQIAYHVSTGLPLWEMNVHQGSVLYLALEDDYQRLQERMSRMFGVEGTDNLHFATGAGEIGKTLLPQLEHFVQEQPGTKLIIIDTLQKARGVSEESFSYADDYDVISKLKRFADMRGVCLMVVHHTRKLKASDIFDTISGTTGLMGCADGAMVLCKERRADLNAILWIVGRDQADQKIYLTRNEERLIWELDHVERELWRQPPDPLIEQIGLFVNADNPEWEGSASDLVSVLNLNVAANILARKLNVNARFLRDLYGIEYRSRHTREGSLISLTRKADM